MNTGAVRRRLVDALRSAAERPLRVLLGNKLRRDPWFEHAACLILKPHRLDLPQVELEDLVSGPIPPVTIESLPRGSWSSPVVDMVAMARVVAAIRPLRVLELGSFRGYTAAAMAEHLPMGGELVAVDIDPKHGSVYRDTPIEHRIERHVCTIEEFGARNSDRRFDLVFVDADHRFDAARSDTEAVLRMLEPDGWIVWHDYANWGYFTGACGVPEYLGRLAQETPVVHLAGTNLAIHRPSWTSSDHPQLAGALAAMRMRRQGDHWETGVARP